jgi:spermidine synthase
MGSRSRLTALYLIFLLSGVAGLGYQMAFVRMFSVGLGHELPAVLAVVGAFFGGLALGAWLLDRPISRTKRPGHWYVGLEVVIGLWGMGCVWLVGPANDLALALMGPEPGIIWQWAVSLGIPLLVLLPATMAMGATLPAIDRFAAPFSPGGRCIGGLYAVNTAGAMIGTLVGAFLLVPLLGYRVSVMAMAGTDLLCAAMMLPLLRSTGSMAIEPDATPESSSTAATVKAPSRRRLLVILFATGLLGIGYEIVGLRVIAQVIENTVYSYAAALGIFLLGTAIGAGLYQRFTTGQHFHRLLGYLLCGLASACLLGGLGLSYSREIYQACRLTLGDSLAAVALSEMAVAACVFLLPTILMGAAFAHLVQAFRDLGGGVGRAFAINTSGGFAAPLIIGVLFMPAFGTKWSLAAVALGYMALLTDYASVKRFALIIPFGCLLLLPGDLRLVRTFEGQRVIAYREGVMASVAVIENQQKHRFLRVNNRYQMGGTSPSAIRFQLRQGHIPLLLHSNPRRALFLGVGTGITPLAAADHPGLQTDAVELVPEVVQALPAFSLDGDDLISANSIRVHVADARRFVKTTDNKYDVIVADLFHPARDGGGMLYTREHFQAIKQRLSPDGLFCQWLPAYQLDHDTLKLITRTFLEVYPDARVVMADVDLNYPAVGLVAVNGDWPNYHSRWLEDRASAPALKDKLQAIDLKGSIGLFGLGIGDASDLRSYAGEGVVNTDNRPLVVYRAPRFAVQQNQTSYGRLIDLIQTIGVNSTMWTAVEGPFEEALGNWIGRRNEALDQAIKK